MKKSTTGVILCLLLLSAGCMHGLSEHKIKVENSVELQQALSQLKPGTRLLLAPGVYSGDIYLGHLKGEDGRPIVIQGMEAADPPVFTGGKQALHLADCSYVILRNLKVQGFPTNGINIDDGGSFDTPAHHITVENVTILATGPKGNHDALKMSGVDHFCVRNCRFEGWGGSGIDMVGCHHGVVEDCNFVGRSGFSQSNGVQLKGGTTDVLVQCCRFENAGQRSINLGGSTGLRFFRPGVGDYEAKNVEIAGNRFVGSAAPVAWVTADGGTMHHNTIITPDKWVLRILQETQDARFKPCHDGVFEHNLILFDNKVQTFVNIGPMTAPDTFKFRHNAWYDLDSERGPALPIPETDGIHLRNLSLDPTGLKDGYLRIIDKRIRNVGAHAYKRPK